MSRFRNYWSDSVLVSRCMVYGVFLVCGYSVWMRAGTYPSVLWPVALLSCLMLLPMLLLRGQPWRDMRSCLLHDPILPAGTFFLLLLAVQCLNSGYGISLDADGAAVWERSPPKWLPWSVEAGYSLQMLEWFFPALTVLLVVRNMLHRSDAKLLLQLIAWNGAAVACTGIVQNVFGSEKMLGIWVAPRCDFFATFDYPNHAAAWFYLNAALVAGLAHDAAVKRKPRIQQAVWSGCFLLCITSCFLSLSRIGVLASTAMLSVAAVIWLKHSLKKGRGKLPVNTIISMVVLVLAGVTLFLGAGHGVLADEVTGTALIGEKSVANDLGGRLAHISRALYVVKDFPIFGTGGWGCHGLGALYIPFEEFGAWLVVGMANVHCDPLQFLSEFGIVGALCIGTVLAFLVKDTANARRNVIFNWLAGGLAMVALHSLIDLPFRCPAVLLEWCILFALLPRLCRKRPDA